MRMRNWSLAALAVAMMLLGSGCVITSSPTVDRYERCNSGDFCRSGTVCVAANTTVTPGVSALFCSTSCFTPADCPSDPSGFPVACVTTASGGQCYRQCGAGNTCPPGFTCGGPPGMTPFCVPGSATTACGASGQACCGGTTCNAGLACVSGTCTTPPPCGRVGEACCSGNVCTDPGSACGSDGLCGLAPYAGCSGASIGAACLGGTNTGGQVVGTTCQRPMISNPGPNGWCTATCSGGQASMCPRPTDPAFASRSFNCYMLQGSSTGQCYLDCVGGQSCPAGTQCVMTTSATGAQVQICAPMPR